MQIVSANLSLSASYQLDVQSATVSAGGAAPAKAGSDKSCSDKPAAAGQPDHDSYQGSVPAAAFGDHRMKHWLARLEHKLEKGDEAGAEKQIERLLARIARSMEKPGTDVIRQAGKDDSAPSGGTSVTGSAVQVHDEAKVALSLSFKTDDGHQFSIDAAIDISRDFARQQVTVTKAA
jgi:hypothetical protein